MKTKRLYEAGTGLQQAHTLREPVVPLCSMYLFIIQQNNSNHVAGLPAQMEKKAACQVANLTI